METGIGNHLHRTLSLLRLHFLVQKDVDAKGIDACVGHGDIRGRVGLRVEHVGGQLSHPAYLGQQLIFAGVAEHQIGWRLAGREDQQQGKKCQGRRAFHACPGRKHTQRLYTA